MPAGAIRFSAAGHHDDRQIGPGGLALQRRCKNLYLAFSESLFSEASGACADRQLFDNIGRGSTNAARDSLILESSGDEIGVAATGSEDQDSPVILTITVRISRQRHERYLCRCHLFFGACEPIRPGRRSVLL